MNGSKDSPIMYFDEAGNGPHEHVCAGGGPTDRIRDWLDRQVVIGGVTPSEAAVVERLIEDIK